MNGPAATAKLREALTLCIDMYHASNDETIKAHLTDAFWGIYRAQIAIQQEDVVTANAEMKNAMDALREVHTIITAISPQQIGEAMLDLLGAATFLLD